MQPDLPIWDLHGPILQTLGGGNRLVLTAPTGSGKSTQVPQMLAGPELALDGLILVLEPRRVAARSLAARVAFEQRVPLGSSVGYQVRFDDRIGPHTRIAFVTEGILVRWLHDNPLLHGIGAVIFDEFHERNLLSDVALALVKARQQSSRPDLKIVVMSATLDAEPVGAYLGGCPLLGAQGRMYPVQTHYLDRPDRSPMPDQAAQTVRRILQSGHEGDLLVFMPGMGEINATTQALRGFSMGEPLAILPLHGDLPPEIQDQAFAPHPRRKIVVATNVAETSVTIDGIRHVVDSGLARIARFDPQRGLNTLQVEEISRASADQRRGRAGRTAPGHCHRLWTESGQLNRPERNTPEIQRADLAEVVLMLHALGIRSAADFDWLDRPDASAVRRAEDLLATLGALHPDSGGLTDTGQAMRRLPMHPRFARMLVEAQRRNCVSEAALCAALVSGRDLLVRLGREDAHVARAREAFERSAESDFLTLREAFHFAQRAGFDVETCRRHGVHAQTARQVADTWAQFRQLAGGGKPGETSMADDRSAEPLLQCVMTGFIDQLCRRRDQGSLECDLTEGRRGTLARESVVHQAPLFVAASIREVAGRGARAMTLLSLASAVRLEWIEAVFPHLLVSQEACQYDVTHKRVASVRARRFRDLTLAEEHLRDIDPGAAARCLAEAHWEGRFELPLFQHELKQWIARVNFLAAACPELEVAPLDDAAIKACLERAFHGCTLAKEAQARPLAAAFHRHLPDGQREWLEEMAPTQWRWEDGRLSKLLYDAQAVPSPGAPPAAPELTVKLHECLQRAGHPTVAEGRVAVRMKLGAPNGKPLETTTNWPGFKAEVYPKMRAALRQKYPGVAWL